MKECEEEKEEKENVAKQIFISELPFRFSMENLVKSEPNENFSKFIARNHYQL